MWHDVTHPKTGRLLFRFDPERDIIQVQERNVKWTVDLAEYRAEQEAPPQQQPEMYINGERAHFGLK